MLIASPANAVSVAISRIAGTPRNRFIDFHRKGKSDEHPPLARNKIEKQTPVCAGMASLSLNLFYDSEADQACLALPL